MNKPETSGVASRNKFAPVARRRRPSSYRVDAAWDAAQEEFSSSHAKGNDLCDYFAKGFARVCK